MHPDRLYQFFQPQFTSHMKDALGTIDQVQDSCSSVVRPRLAGNDEQRKEVRTYAIHYRSGERPVYQIFQISGHFPRALRSPREVDSRCHLPDFYRKCGIIVGVRAGPDLRGMDVFDSSLKCPETVLVLFAAACGVPWIEQRVACLR